MGDPLLPQTGIFVDRAGTSGGRRDEAAFRRVSHPLVIFKNSVAVETVPDTGFARGYNFPRIFQFASGNIAVVWGGDGTHGTPGVIETTDGGVTWSAPVTIVADQYFGINQQNNKIYVIAYGVNDLQLYTYTDLGVTWSAPTTIYTNALVPNAGGISLVMQGNTFKWVDEFFNLNSNGTIYVLNSSDWVTWHGPYALSISPFRGQPSQVLSSLTVSNLVAADVIDFPESGFPPINSYWIGPPNPLNITIFVTKPCSLTQLQCWWYPTLFFGLYLGVFSIVARKAETTSDGTTYMMVSALDVGALAQTAMGLLNFAIPLVLITLTVVYVVRGKRRG